MIHSSLPDLTAASHQADLIDLHDPACTICHLDHHMVQMYRLLFTGLHYPLTDTQVCRCLSSDPAPPTDMHSTPGQALAMSLILGVHRRHTSVPLRLITLGRCRLVFVGLWDHVHPSLLTCASQDRVTMPAHQWTCLQVSHPILGMVSLMVRLHLKPSRTQQELTPAPVRTCP